tara:strand:+ start:10033 stop:10449 length:417 start_codon:yes stop_codon:yes gene_type:complete
MKIIKISNNSFDKKFLEELIEKKKCLIAVFSKSCIHCILMKPEWLLFKKKLNKINSNCVLLEIDANELNNFNSSELKKNINGYPSIIAFNKGKKIKEFNGNRTMNNMLKFFRNFIIDNKKNKTKKKFKSKKNTKSRKL